MSRIILFRGQTRIHGEKVKNFAGDLMPSNWVYGGIFPQNQGEDRAIIYQQDPQIEKFVVYADTIGQYTGVNDRNGIKIFEGDIVFYDYEDEHGVIKYDTETARFVISCETVEFDFDNLYGNQLEVVGNMYDNPEFLRRY